MSAEVAVAAEGSRAAVASNVTTTTKSKKVAKADKADKADTVARVASVGLTGLDGTAVVVEAALSNQLPGMHMVGMLDTALAEAKQRVRLATQQAGVSMSERLVVVNLSPAAVPKQGSGFDLAIALAVAAASGHVPAQQMSKIAHLGELGLGGELRRPPGLLGAVLAARKLGFDQVMVPEICAEEARLVPKIEVIAVRDLRGAVAWYRGEPQELNTGSPDTASTGGSSTEFSGYQILMPDSQSPQAGLDMSDVIGQPEAIEALVIAAAGRHHLSMVGPPGAGKTLLATRLPTILPDLDEEEQIRASSIASLGGSTLSRLVTRPPFESPHHTATTVSVIGGGSGGAVRPGAITRACHGVLFLDEAPQFQSSVLDALRQPLESGTIEIQRSELKTTLPATLQLVLAANPCPCGNAGSPDTATECRCTPHMRARYMSRISGPITDRIDLRLSVRRVSSALQNAMSESRPTSDDLRQRVVAARARAAERLYGTPWKVNADVPGSWLRNSTARLPRVETVVLDRALEVGSLTMRGYDRALKVAWTIADLAGQDRPGRAEIAQALALKVGVAL